ncbi:hypothetical protein HVZ29_10430 [Escherichia coli]|nr:hypothetical protein HVZ29_10430 [Escherichia coli]
MDFSRLLCVVCILTSSCFSSFATARESLPLSQKAASINTQWEGRYMLTQEGETLNDGSTVFQTWDINIDPVSSTAKIDITTWHAPYSCQGGYIVQETGATLLFTHRDEHEECIYSAPQFEMKKQSNGFYVKGEMFGGDANQWQRLVKRTPGVEGAPAAKFVIEKCESVPQNSDEYHSQTRCFYPAMSLEETYKRYNSENLVPILKPGEDFVIEKLGDTDSVEYTWDGNQVLKITQNFPGGITKFLFVTDKSGTTVTKNDYPD